LPTLMTLSQTAGTRGWPVWQMNLMSDRPETILGRPAIPTEYCKTIGTTGDIILVNWGEYLEGTYMPYETAESMHVRFLENETAFRVTMMNAGAHWWRSALSPKNGASLSPVVYLDTRA
jgi:HK97 family phage major capsid protein